jgi:DNA-binding NtrC family response regulator
MADPVIYLFVDDPSSVTPPDGLMFHFINPDDAGSLVGILDRPILPLVLPGDTLLEQPIDLLVVEDELGALKDILVQAVVCKEIGIIGVCTTAALLRRALKVLPPPRVLTLDFLLQDGRSDSTVIPEVGALYIDARNTWKDCVILGLTGFAPEQRENPAAQRVRESLNRHGDVVFGKNAHLHHILPEILLDALMRWKLRCLLHAQTESTAAPRGGFDPASDPDYGKFFAPTRSEAFRDLIWHVAKAAATPHPVLLLGESGTGKEQLANFIHQKSGAQGEFVAINCGAIPAGMEEAELFGYLKGAFTDAKADRKGLIEQARGGTLFLDEIGDLPIAAQVKLLRVLQDKAVRPLGAEKLRDVSFRLVCATHRDLEQLVEAGRFREDLYYRISVLPVRIPPLRARAEDIPALVQRFLAKQKNPPEFSPQALDRLSGYAWPGNVRELQNLVAGTVALHDGPGPVSADELPQGRFVRSGWPDQATARFHALLKTIPASKISEIEALLSTIESGLSTMDDETREQATLGAVHSALYGKPSNSLHGRLSRHVHGAALLLATRESAWPATVRNQSVRKVVDSELVRLLREPPAPRSPGST